MQLARFTVYIDTWRSGFLTRLCYQTFAPNSATTPPPILSTLGQAYHYREGYIRTSSVKYSLSKRGRTNKLMHLTNDGDKMRAPGMPVLVHALIALARLAFDSTMASSLRIPRFPPLPPLFNLSFFS